MKDFFVWDDATKGLAIVGAIILVMYVGSNITPITIETIVSGAMFQGIWGYFQSSASSVAPSRASLQGLEIVLVILSLIFFALTIWFSLRAGDIHRAEDEKYAPIHIEEIAAKEKMVQWQVVLNHVNSESPAEWKLGILEADSMLDEILESEGCQGETIGEKLKAMDPADLASYGDAWEAHKVRNQIAHEGAATMDLSKKLARDTIFKFEKVFKELGYI